MRLVAWNIQHGGGKRAPRIADELAALEPDVVGLSEFHNNTNGKYLIDRLTELGLVHAVTSSEEAGINSLLVASRWELQPLSGTGFLSESPRWLPIRVLAPVPFIMIKVHVPNRDMGKWTFHAEALEALEKWRDEPAIMVGDTNTGYPGLDEETKFFNRKEKGWFDALLARGWFDVYRHRNPTGREFTWYSSNKKNGLLDQAFVSERFLPRVRGIQHHWGSNGKSDAASDHAAIVLDLE